MANISQVQLPSGVSYPIKAPVIPYGMVDSTSTATVFTATVPGITELTDGTIMMLHNGVVTSASGFTVNINGLGAKKCYNNMTNATQDTTIFNVAYTMVFVYASNLDEGNGGWWIYRGYDGNTNTIGYQLRTNSGNKVAADTGYRYRLWFTSADGTKWVPANTSTSTAATGNRSLNTRKIDPFGPIVYRATNGTCNSGSGLGATGIWQQYTLNIGYSYMQRGFSLTFPAPVYVKCTPQTDGSAVMDSIVQALPSSKDGKIYLYLGTAYSATNMELEMVHPVYYHDGNGIKIWTGSTIPSVSAVASLSSGTQVGTVTVDGTTTTFYAPAAGGGTVTSVGVSNATNGGLTVSGSPITGSGTISVGHTNVLTNAQTTQAVYPIKIDKNGHISSYGSAVAITDEKLKVEVATDAILYPVLTGNTTTSTTKWYDTTVSYYHDTTNNAIRLAIGDQSTTQGGIYFGSGSAYPCELISSNNTALRTITLPDASGTVALTSDITTAVLTATDDGAGNVTLGVTGVTSANLNSATGVSF